VQDFALQGGERDCGRPCVRAPARAVVHGYLYFFKVKGHNCGVKMSQEMDSGHGKTGVIDDSIAGVISVD
jgi:hypothetical protein